MRPDIHKLSLTLEVISLVTRTRAPTIGPEVVLTSDRSTANGLFYHQCSSAKVLLMGSIERSACGSTLILHHPESKGANAPNTGKTQKPELQMQSNNKSCGGKMAKHARIFNPPLCGSSVAPEDFWVGSEICGSAVPTEALLRPYSKQSISENYKSGNFYS